MKSTQKIIENIYQNLLKVRTNEKILILCDKKKKSIAEKFFEYGYQYGCSTLCLEIDEAEQNAQEPDPEVARLMLKHDILLLITSKSLSHTNARKKATEKGARVISMPGLTEDTLIRCVDIDYAKLRSLHKKLADRMSKAKKITITTSQGTDLTFKIYNKKIIYLVSLDKKGDFHNIPMGEVFVSPKEGTANGTYVVDGSQSGVGKLKKPIIIKVKDGQAVNISSKKLDNQLKILHTRKAYNIAEFGIGTNPKAKIIGNVLEDEKVLGTCHIALGNNYSFGGKVDVPIHLDGIIKKPTIHFDEKIIMKNGKLMI